VDLQVGEEAFGPVTGIVGANGSDEAVARGCEFPPQGTGEGAHHRIGVERVDCMEAVVFEPTVHLGHAGIAAGEEHRPLGSGLVGLGDGGLERHEVHPIGERRGEDHARLALEGHHLVPGEGLFELCEGDAEGGGGGAGLGSGSRDRAIKGVVTPDARAGGRGDPGVGEFVSRCEGAFDGAKALRDALREVAAFKAGDDGEVPRGGRGHSGREPRRGAGPLHLSRVDAHGVGPGDDLAAINLQHVATFGSPGFDGRRFHEAVTVGGSLEADDIGPEHAVEQFAEAGEARLIERCPGQAKAREGGVQEEADAAAISELAEEAGDERELVILDPAAPPGSCRKGRLGEAAVHAHVRGPGGRRGRYRPGVVPHPLMKGHAHEVEERPGEAVGGFGIVPPPGRGIEGKAAVVERAGRRFDQLAAVRVGEMVVEGAPAGADPCRAFVAIPRCDGRTHGREQASRRRDSLGPVPRRGAMVEISAIGEDEVGAASHHLSIGRAERLTVAPWGRPGPISITGAAVLHSVARKDWEMNESLAARLAELFPDADRIEIEELSQIPGGFSRETYRFDAHVHQGGTVHVHPMILRKDPPRVAALLRASNRQVEHELLESIRRHTDLPVSRSYLYELDPAHFGEPAMVLQRMAGSGQTSDLFHGGPAAAQADDVMRHLCEIMVALHTADIEKLNERGELSDPRHVGIDISSWDRYMESTFAYYLRCYEEIDFDPSMFVYMDSFLELRRKKPRPLRLSLVHGDFNPANFLFENGKVTALIDWENSRIGDPREDLGWMKTMDLLSNTNVMDHPKSEGGFLAYYNKLTGWGITEEELDYFSLMGTANIAVEVAAAVKRRVDKQHMQVLHLYVLQPSVLNLTNFARMLNYPGVS
jgi:aminoglycoside phosphotransferase (APT) family kinase protein